MWRMRQSPHLLCLSCHPPEKESSDVARRRLPVGTAGEKVACSPAVQTSDLSCSRLQQIVSSEARPPPPQQKAGNCRDSTCFCGEEGFTEYGIFLC